MRLQQQCAGLPLSPVEKLYACVYHCRGIYRHVAPDNLNGQPNSIPSSSRRCAIRALLHRERCTNAMRSILFKPAESLRLGPQSERELEGGGTNAGRRYRPAPKFRGQFPLGLLYEGPNRGRGVILLATEQSRCHTFCLEFGLVATAKEEAGTNSTM